LKEKLKLLEESDARLEALKKKISKEPNFNVKMAINVEMARLKKKRKKKIEEFSN